MRAKESKLEQHLTPYLGSPPGILHPWHVVSLTQPHEFRLSLVFKLEDTSSQLWDKMPSPCSYSSWPRSSKHLGALVPFTGECDEKAEPGNRVHIATGNHCVQVPSVDRWCGVCVCAYVHVEISDSH